MKAIKVAAIVLILLAGIITYLALTRIAYIQGPKTQQNVAQLGMKLDAPTSKASISGFTAIVNAWKSFHTTGFDRITVEYQLITAAPQGINKLPAYIVSFRNDKGRLEPSTGPPGSSHMYLMHEFNVIVDATTGHVIEAIQYR